MSLSLSSWTSSKRWKRSGFKDRISPATDLDCSMFDGCLCVIDSSLSELIYSQHFHGSFIKNSSSGLFSKSLFQGSKLHLHLLRYSMARFFGVQHKLPTPAAFGPLVWKVTRGSSESLDGISHNKPLRL